MTTSEQARKLIADQQNSWALARSNYNALKNVKTRNLGFDGFDMLVQFNPERIRSSAAKVDVKSIEARPCFLCKENRPPEQESIPVLEKYEILVNPFPIFPEHLTIPHIDHVDQAIEDKFEDMLDIARLLDDFTVFYNGPKCGASAPDHFHFQAGIRRFMPIERDYRQGSFFRDATISDGVEIIQWTDYKRTLLSISGRDRAALSSFFNHFFLAFQKLQNDESEPMLNILCSYDGARWHIHLFPRKAHRPEQYFENGEKQILLSPASVDLGGVLITPREEDYNKITMADVQDIFRQVCLEEKVLTDLMQNILIK